MLARIKKNRLLFILLAPVLILLLIAVFASKDVEAADNLKSNTTVIKDQITKEPEFNRSIAVNAAGYLMQAISPNEVCAQELSPLDTCLDSAYCWHRGLMEQYWLLNPVTQKKSYQGCCGEFS